MSSERFAARVRADFPVFERSVGGRPIAFFDGPGGSQVPRAVADAMTDYLLFHNANTHGFFATSEETDAAITRARESAAAFVNGSPREIAFGQNMTTLTFHLSRSLAREWREGDEIVVTELDHQANVAPWLRAAEERGVTVHVVPLDRGSFMLDHDAFARVIGPRTRLVAVGAASNALGTVNDVRRVADRARAAGALTFVDAVHYAPHFLPDVQAFGCDFLSCSAYKFFGPHVGLLWGRAELLERLTPYKVPPASDTVPERWETGTLNHEGIVGADACIRWIASLAPEPGADLRTSLAAAYRAIHAHESALFARLWDGLAEIGGVTRYGVPADGPRTPTAGFALDAAGADEVARRLAAEGVFVWNGDFYATTVVEALGLLPRGGLIRAGVAPYTTADDVERLLDGVRRIAAG